MKDVSGTNVKQKRRYFFSGVAVSLLTVALLYFIYMFLPSLTPVGKPDTIQTIRKAKEIERTIERNYFGEIDEQKQTDTMFAGLVAGLGDKYSVYYTKEEYQAMIKRLDGEYTGIGIGFTQDTEDLSMVVQAVKEGTPAEKAGLKIGDKILSIDGKSVTSMSTSEMSDIIQSNQDKEITLVVKRTGEPGTMFLRLTPEKIVEQSVEGRMLDAKIGYLKINSFTKNATAQFEEVLKSLQSSGMQRLVIDLRDNPGGLVQSCTDILRKILPKGILVYDEDKNRTRKYYKDEDDEMLNIPYAVLVNENSASSSEIFAGAIKDYKTGRIIGMQTFGKGIIQNMYALSDGSVLQLTSNHYFTPDGNDIHGVGVEPDQVVEQPSDGSADAQLEAAIAYLNQE